MLKKVSLPFLGFIQATGLVIYIVLIASFLNNVTKMFNTSTGEYFAPIIMLLMFIGSAVISASIVLGRAGVLFWEKKYSDSFKLLGWTVGWAFTYALIFISTLVLF